MKWLLQTAFGCPWGRKQFLAKKVGSCSTDSAEEAGVSQHSICQSSIFPLHKYTDPPHRLRKSEESHSSPSVEMSFCFGQLPKSIMILSWPVMVGCLVIIEHIWKLCKNSNVFKMSREKKHVSQTRGLFVLLLWVTWTSVPLGSQCMLPALRGDTNHSSGGRVSHIHVEA